MDRLVRIHQRFSGSLVRAATVGATAALLAAATPAALGEDAPKAAEKTAAPDLMSQTPEQIVAKNAGCVSCHTKTDSASMHESDVPLACVDCHGGDGMAREKDRAHVLPKESRTLPSQSTFTKDSSANPIRSGATEMWQSAEYIRFVNPADLRVAAETCGQGSCHSEAVQHVRKSMMTHGGSLWGAAAYNNSALPVKNTIVGESYTREGLPQLLKRDKNPLPEETAKKGILPFLAPLPRWEISQVGGVFRTFERGGHKPLEVGNPDPLEGDEPGKPEKRLSNRGFGTLNRTDPVIIGAQKTRLMDPLLSMFGTNDHPGDYRSSGCAACHVVYANDRDPEHSGPWAKYGNRGLSFTEDPTIPKWESGHPIQHKFTRSIPSSQCIVCHIHPGTNMVMTYYGSVWWDNETDGINMYPEEAKHPSAEEQVYRIEAANPEGSAVRGKWSDEEFLDNLTDLNPKLKKTQFADFHGHGWVFRNVYKQDRKGDLLDARGKIVSWDDPDKFKKAVHLADIHLEKGMHCIDCHFEQDAHGNGELYGEVRNTVEIGCIDCHGTIQKKFDPTDKKWATSGPAGPNKMSKYNSTPFGPRFFAKNGKVYQRSAVTKGTEWEIVQTRDTIDPASPYYNEASRLAKTLRRDGKTWGDVPANPQELAHADPNMTCFACHSSWMTTCGGCHLPQQANRRTPMWHYEGQKLRNWTSYNYQVIRDDAFQLGKDGSVVGGRISPVRSSSALVVSSQNAQREWIYVQQQTVSAEGYSGQAMNTHVPHTVRAAETKVCTDCHVSAKGDNNAVMAQLLLFGTNYMNFLGRFVYVGTEDEGLFAVAVTERDEPQAVIGSHLHHLAYPDRYHEFVERDHRHLQEAYEHPGTDVLDWSWLFGRKREVRSLVHRGEYLYAAQGPGGLRIYDVANIDHKGFSERFSTAPVSPLGQRLYVATKDATAVAAPTTLAVDATRAHSPVNEEQPIHPLYTYIYVTDAEEGLIVVPVWTLFDGNPDNNFVERAVTFNPNGALTGAENITIIGTYAYISTEHALYVVDLDEPLNPKITAEIAEPLIDHPVAVANQFRYAFVLDRIGMKVLDITDLAKPKVVENAVIPLADPHDIYVARTYAYVAGGRQGLVIIDVEKPEKPKIDQIFTADGELDDARAVRVGMTNASAFAYVADGKNGLRVLQITSPETTPGNFGFSPRPMPRLIATYHTHGPAIALPKGLDRDRGVDESGNQLVVFGRRGGRPFNKEELHRMYLMNGKLYAVTDGPPENGKEIAFAEAQPKGPVTTTTTRRRTTIHRETPGLKLEPEPGLKLREEPGLKLNRPEGGLRLRGNP